VTPIIALRFVDREGRKRLQFARRRIVSKIGKVEYDWEDVPYVPSYLENPLGIPVNPEEGDWMRGETLKITRIDRE
jgi:hypothetical protein